MATRITCLLRSPPVSVGTVEVPPPVDEASDALQLAIADHLCARGFSPVGARYFARLAMKPDGLREAAQQFELILAECRQAGLADIHNSEVMATVWRNLTPAAKP